MKLVSIIVPVYNREKIIVDCYNSLIRQTYTNIEIIFVDDGSVDNTLKVIKGFNDQRVVVISQRNSGPSEARRHGFKRSYGEYICFVDSDDTIDADYIEKLVNSMEKYNSNISMGRLGVHYYQPVIKNVALKSRRRPDLIDLDVNKGYLPAFTPGIVGKLFRRELLEFKRCKFMANEDLMIMYPLYVKGRYISIVNDAIYHYHLAKTSQFKEYLYGYKFNNLYNTFEPLRLVYEEFLKMGKLDYYYYEIEMLFIKNISERIWNIMDCVDDKIYRCKFISVMLDYLECFFSDWDRNPYYISGYKLGEISDIFHVFMARKEFNSIQRKKLNLDLSCIYDRYKEVEELYEKNK